MGLSSVAIGGDEMMGLQGGYAHSTYPGNKEKHSSVLNASPVFVSNNEYQIMPYNCLCVCELIHAGGGAI